jgi:hypothetical protein
MIEFQKTIPIVRIFDVENRIRFNEDLKMGEEEMRGEIMTHPPTLRTARQGRTIAVVGDVYRFLATGDDTDGKYALWEAIVTSWRRASSAHS